MASSLYSTDVFYDALDPNTAPPPATIEGTTTAVPTATQPAGQQEPTTSSLPLEEPAPAAAPAPAQPAAEATPTPAPGALPQPAISPYTAPPPSNYSSLFAPAATQLQSSQTNLQNALTQFQTAAGPSRTYNQLGAEGTLETALGGGAIDPAAALLGAQYGGPGGLDQATLDQLYGQLQTLYPQFGSLSSFGGIEDLIRQRTSGLSSGQRAMESERLLNDQAFRTEAQQYQEAVRALFGDVSRQSGEARQFAEQRTGEEADIAKRSREYVTGEAGEITGELETRTAAERTRREAQRAGYGKFQESGTLEDLAAAGVDITPFQTESRQLDVEAEATRSQVMNDPKYETIKDIPTLQLGSTRHGREALFLPKEWVEANKEEYTKKERHEILLLARERQKALEAAGFASGTSRFRLRQQGLAGKKAPHERGKAGTEDLFGKYGELENLYFGPEGGFTPEDLRPSVSYEEGTALSPEVLATETERTRYNLANQLLGSPEALETPQNQYYAPTIRADTEPYLAREAATTEALRNLATESGQSWRKKVQQAREAARIKSSFLGRTAGLLDQATFGMAPMGLKMAGMGTGMMPGPGEDLDAIVAQLAGGQTSVPTFRSAPPPAFLPAGAPDPLLEQGL